MYLVHLLVRRQVSSYRNQHIALLGDTQLRGEYFGWYRTRVGEDGHSFHVGDVDSDEGREGSTRRHQIDCDVPDIPPPSSAP